MSFAGKRSSLYMKQPPESLLHWWEFIPILLIYSDEEIHDMEDSNQLFYDMKDSNQLFYWSKKLALVQVLKHWSVTHI